ncbi:MAG: hypothetical protein WAZ27_05180 [Minisyncoccia bacterium]
MAGKPNTREFFRKTMIDFLTELRSGLTEEEMDAYEDALAEVVQDELGVVFSKPEDDLPEDED